MLFYSISFVKIISLTNGFLKKSVLRISADVFLHLNILETGTHLKSFDMIILFEIINCNN